MHDDADLDFMLLPTITANCAPEPQPVEWLIHGLLPRDATILAGQPGARKSVMTAAMIAALTTRQPFVGRDVANGANVLIFDTDGAWDGFGRILRAALRGLGVPAIPNTIQYCSTLDPIYRESGFPLYGPLNQLGPNLAYTVERHQTDLLVIDSLTTAMGGDPNNARDVREALSRGLGDVRSLGCAVLVLDHTAKSNAAGTMVTPLGSQAKRAWARQVITVQTVDGAEEPLTSWTLDKSNVGAFTPFFTRVTFTSAADGSLDALRVELVDGETVPSRNAQGGREAHKAVLNAAKENAEVKRSDFPSGGTYDRAFRTLLNEKRLEKVKPGVYRFIPRP